MQHRVIGIACLCIAGVVLFQSTSVRASEMNQSNQPAAESAEVDTEFSANTMFARSVGVTLDRALESKKEVQRENSMAAAAGVAADFASDKTEEEYKKAALEGAGAYWGYTNLGIANVDNNLNIRKLPQDDGKLAGKLPKDAACEILEAGEEWTLIKSGEVEGYVKSDFLLTGWKAKKRAEEMIRKVAVVSSDSLRVREEPNTESEVVTMVPSGEVLELVEVQDGWAKVAIDSEEDYFVSLDHIKIEEKLSTAITMTELLYGQGVSDIRVDISQFAKQFVGNPYVWGGTSLTKGADCSGFVLSVFKNFGVSLPRTSQTQATAGTKITMSEAKPGDLIFYAKGGRINHVAIYIGGNQVVHASNPKTGIRISNYNYRTPYKVVRVLPNL